MDARSRQRRGRESGWSGLDCIFSQESGQGGSGQNETAPDKEGPQLLQGARDTLRGGVLAGAEHAANILEFFLLEIPKQNGEPICFTKMRQGFIQGRGHPIPQCVRPGRCCVRFNLSSLPFTALAALLIPHGSCSNEARRSKQPTGEQNARGEGVGFASQNYENRLWDLLGKMRI